MLKIYRIILSASIMGCCSSSRVSAVVPVVEVDSVENEVAQLEATTNQSAAPTPSPLVTVNFGSGDMTFWPFAGNNFSGVGQDPVNLIFVGKCDPREIRAALMSLEADRTGFPPMPPFNSKWQDAIGDIETAYGGPQGWSGSAIQLACGEYQPLRFHLRLFRVGEWTLANAHLDLLIPGTTDHQVISWEVPEQFVVADFIRSGLLDPDVPMMTTDKINPSPFRTIPAIIYNGLPVELRVLIGGPTNDVTDDVPIGTDGRAVVLNLAKKVPVRHGTFVQDFIINFDQVIPKPLCASGPLDYLYVKGPVHLHQVSRQMPTGLYSVLFVANGELTVTPVNPQTKEPTGPSMNAIVKERHGSALGDKYFSASGTKYQRLGERSKPVSGEYFSRLFITSIGNNGFEEILHCGDEPWHTPAEDGTQ